VRRSSGGALLLSSLAALSVWAAPRSAHAWCRTTTNVDFVEDGINCDTVGRPIYWSSKCVGFSLQQDASVQVDLATARAIAKKGFDEWTNVDCPLDPRTCKGGGGGHPTISGRDLGPVACDKVEYNQHLGNANVIMFRDTSWPHDQPDVTLALTTVTFSVDSGEIYDADMEVNSNPTLNPITTGDPTGRVVYDFYSIMTHELGHFVGLAHTQKTNDAATMYPEYKRGTTFMRDPSLDDICAICTAYPPNRATVCSDAPRNGLALQCGGEDLAQNSKGCHCAIAGGRSGLDVAAGSGVVALGLGLLARRRRRRAPRG
jgi:hypothetical protein